VNHVGARPKVGRGHCAHGTYLKKTGIFSRTNNQSVEIWQSPVDG
jgi:hypothetical protein